MKSSVDKPMPLWDLFTRVFHWFIVAAVPLAWMTAETGNFNAHEWLGYTVLVLASTRVVWGFVGSRHSRFSDFLVGPGRLVTYIRSGEWSSAGHNPLGGLAVIVMLLLLLLQAGSGLFNSDDALFSGPLYHWAESGFRDAMGEVHEIAYFLLLAMIALHISAVLYHQFRHGMPLIQAMWKGSSGDRQGRSAALPQWRVLLILGSMSLLLWWGLEQVPPPQIMW